MAQLLSKAMQQKDNMCGSFCAARILNDFSLEQIDGEPVDEDFIAIRAGASLPDPDLPPALPRGAESRTGYRFELPVAPLEEVGTSPAGLIRAIDSAARGRLRAVPIRGEWNADRVERLVELATAGGARIIANLHTGRLWGSRPSPEQVLAELNGEHVSGPPADWDVGHFVELTTLIRGRKGSLVVVHDTYPSLGWDGYHVQPPRNVASALLRGDGREGGVLAVLPADNADAVAAIALGLGLEIDVWDNGCRS